MDLDGARIYNDGVGINKDVESRIRRIVTSIKKISAKSDIGMRFVKRGRVIEGLLWGKAKDIPIGVYNCGPSLNVVLDKIQRKVRKECVKIETIAVPLLQPKNKTYSHPPLEMAG
jgi:hypothetical protein